MNKILGKIFARAVLVHGDVCARLTVRSVPPSTQGEIFRRTCLGGGEKIVREFFRKMELC
jgi:hypothetical protein